MDRIKKVPVALTIAGSDSSGGAGIQSDLKTFASLGVYGVSVITAVTAQNTQKVTGIHDIPEDMVTRQIRAVTSDIQVDTIKTGMLSSSGIIKTVASELKDLQIKSLVVDPVMVAKSGDILLKEDAVESLCAKLLPLATVVTPNLPEAEVLCGIKIENSESAEEAARRIIALGAKSVVIKGGHLPGDPVDLYYDGFEFHRLQAQRVDTRNTHGTGCTFASAIAAGLSKGMEQLQAITAAKEYVTEAMKYAYPIGHGHGPLNHFYTWWKSKD